MNPGEPIHIKKTVYDGPSSTDPDNLQVHYIRFFLAVLL